MTSKHRPMFVFLMETKATTNKVEELRVSLGFDGKICVERTGMSGGLAFLWRDAAAASLIRFSQNHIDMKITLPGRPAWRLTGFYGEPDRANRHVMWDLLRQLKDDSPLPWAVVGDFNDIACHSEKRGIHPHPASLIEGFNDAFGDCQLIDLGMSGGRFTWEKGRGTEEWVEERLDRAVATTEWMDMHEDVVVHNLFARSSDHCAIMVKLDAEPVRAAPRAFKFESAWLLEEGCAKVVGDAWRLSRGMDFQSRITTCGEHLRRWGGDHHRRFGVRIQHLRRILVNLKEDRNPQGIMNFREAEDELEGLLKSEEVFWRQRSKQLWLKHGDANTKYFHKTATARRKQNQLLRLQDHNDIWQEGEAMHAEVLRYYTSIFSSSTCSVDLFHRVREQVTDEMHSSLRQPFTIAEVRAALFDMAPEKTPGPDGMSPAFFQHFWPVVGHDLAVFLIKCVETKSFPLGLNDSNIVLIPKKSNPIKVSDLRPIALCNVIYKVLAKMLANRLKGHLEHIVSHSQSAFVPDRLLTDNILVAGEIGHYLRRKTGGSIGWAALKLDMAKAYDRMEWSFLEGMMRALGFEKDWTDLLMLCVTSVNYSILVNGTTVGQVCPTRGIRQGDPLSPYLFILCAEGLSILLQQAEERGDIHGVRVARGVPAITHLFFADDSLLFFRANPQEASRVKNCLDLYCTASGQLINFDKSSAVFSRNTPVQARELVSDLFGVHENEDLGRYLGLPSVLGRHKGKLGFKKLHQFNIALLAKQGWHLLTQPESLVSRIMKAKYYPKTDFMEAQIGGNPSFLWRSILAGKQVLQLGIARRVGNSLHTLIWGWPWLSSSSTTSLSTPCIEELRHATVNGLLDAHGRWDEEVVRDLFNEEDVARIFSTPININIPDCWRWVGDIRGRYTVQHGYQLLMNETTLYETGGTFQAWDALWTLPIPPKVKNLLWRCARGILPVRDALRQKRVWIGGGCPICGFLVETVSHLFCECSFALEVWEQVDVLRGLDFLNYLQLVISNPSRTEATKQAAVIWTIWQVRNDVVWHDKSPPSLASRNRVVELQSTWSSTFGKRRNTAASSVARHLWAPPPSNVLKCNVDAAIFEHGAGYGAIIQDHEGWFVAACGGRLGNDRDPFVAESLAVMTTLNWLREQHFNNIILESDCLNLCTAFNSNCNDFSYIGLIVKQCRSIAKDIGVSTLSHVRRTANCVAHALARATDSMTGSGMWLHVPPDCISDLLCN
ncbi:PREDICTED: uncharacterized protein LOC109159839 [Ipomoea nil]|uniref:uncharacterized protein LOC109159839 n=1 Tax=Ipomoea nil TaxID=35883 RepID=UPI000900AADE|nr:PREDICTED: uncharacterized protein LOC109159839 [Ipomoea nil]